MGTQVRFPNYSKARMARPKVKWHIVLVGCLWACLLFLCVVVGYLAAVMPAGFMARLGAFPLLLGAVLILWAMPKRKESPDELLNGLLLVLLVLINLWPEYVFYRWAGLPAINPIKIAWLAFLLVSMFSVLACHPPMQRLYKRCAAHSMLIGSICFLMLWRVVSSLAGDEPIVQTWQLGGEILSYYLVFFMALAVLRDEKDVFRLLAVLAVVATAQALIASYESIVQHTLFEKFISVSQDDPGTLQSILMDKFRGGHYRAQGTFVHPMVLAEFLAMMVPLAVAVFLRSKRFVLRAITAGFVPLAIAMILASRSRSGIAVLLTALLLVGILMMLPRKRLADQRGSSSSLLIIAFLLPVLIIFGYFAGSEILTLVMGRNQGEASSTMSRLSMLEKGIPLLLDSPFLGYGNGLGAVKLGFFDGARYNIDSYFLSTALDAGVPGLVAFVMVFGSAVLLGLRGYTQREDMVGSAAGLIAVSLVMLIGVKSVLSITSGFTLAYVLIAALIVLRETPHAAVASKKMLPGATPSREGGPQ